MGQQNQNVLPGSLQQQPSTRGEVAPRSTFKKKVEQKQVSVLVNANYSTIVFDTEITSKLVLPYSANRASLTIQNRSANNIYVNFDAAATVNSLLIPAGGIFSPNVAPVNAIFILGAVAGDTVVLCEGLR